MSVPANHSIPETKQSHLTSFLLASAISVGANLVYRKKTNTSLTHALVNGIAKGAASTVIFSTVKPDTAVNIAASAGLIIGSSILIDSVMKDFDSVLTKEKTEREVLP